MNMAFWPLALIVLAGAVGVIADANVFHAALWLVFSFLGVAGVYVLLSAEFLAITQVLVYIGAISVMLVFAVMLTRPVIGKTNLSSFRRPLAAIVSAVLSGIMAWAEWWGPWPAGGPAPGDGPRPTGLEMLTTHLLPFEIAGLILFVALVGAIAIGRGVESK